MTIVKHPMHGCRHVPPEEVAELVAAGWTRFPRSRAEKEAGAWPPPAAAAVTARAIIRSTAAEIGIEQTGKVMGAGMRALDEATEHGGAGLPNEPTCTGPQTPDHVDQAPEIPVFTASRAQRKTARA